VTWRISVIHLSELVTLLASAECLGDASSNGVMGRPESVNWKLPVYCMECEQYPTTNLDIMQQSQSVLTRPTQFLLPKSYRYVEARKRVVIASGVWYVSNEMVKTVLDGKEKLCHLAAELSGSQFPGRAPLMWTRGGPIAIGEGLVLWLCSLGSSVLVEG
jgi:hypothetical protein